MYCEIPDNCGRNGIDQNTKNSTPPGQFPHSPVIHSWFVLFHPIRPTRLCHPSTIEISAVLTLSLAICRVAEPIALASCFPYAWAMVKGFHIGDDNNASFYAGLFISAFSFAESLTGMFWGCLSDRMGRKPVLLIGCAGTMLSMLVVGFAPNFWTALVGRVLGGLLSMLPHVKYASVTAPSN